MKAERAKANEFGKGLKQKLSDICKPDIISEGTMQ